MKAITKEWQKKIALKNASVAVARVRKRQVACWVSLLFSLPLSSFLAEDSRQGGVWWAVFGEIRRKALLVRRCPEDQTCGCRESSAAELSNPGFTRFGVMLHRGGGGICAVRNEQDTTRRAARRAGSAV